jgi:hypothetical protein
VIERLAAHAAIGRKYEGKKGAGKSSYDQRAGVGENCGSSATREDCTSACFIIHQSRRHTICSGVHFEYPN